MRLAIHQRPPALLGAVFGVLVCAIYLLPGCNGEDDGPSGSVAVTPLPSIGLEYTGLAVTGGGGIGANMEDFQEDTQENQTTFSGSAIGSAQWQCADDPSFQANVYGSANMEFDLSGEPATNSVTGFTLSGTTSATCDVQNNGIACYGVIAAGGGGDALALVELAVLEVDALAELDLQFGVEGEGFRVRVQVTEADNANFSGANLILDLDYLASNTPPGNSTASEEIDLVAGHFYLFDISWSATAATQSESVSLSSSANCNVEVQFKGVLPGS